MLFGVIDWNSRYHIDFKNGHKSNFGWDLIAMYNLRHIWIYVPSYNWQNLIMVLHRRHPYLILHFKLMLAFALIFLFNVFGLILNPFVVFICIQKVLNLIYVFSLWFMDIIFKCFRFIPACILSYVFKSKLSITVDFLLLSC